MVELSQQLDCVVLATVKFVWLYNVKTEAVFQADRWTVLPMPDMVIERLNQLADIDKVTVAKKF